MEKFSVDSNIEQAFTLSSDFYLSETFFNLAKEKIFAKTWQFCLDTSELSQIGQTFPFTLLPGLLNEPLLFVRDNDDHLHCVSNVCTHRGNLLVQQPCITKQLRCGYHGRRFTLSGEFLHMPEFENVKNFPSAEDNLAKISHDKLGNFIFASLSPHSSFQHIVADIRKRLFWFPFSSLRLDKKRSKDYLVQAHWALYCENYLEGLHIPFVHPGLRRSIDFSKYTTEIYQHANLQLALANKDEESFTLPKESYDYGKAVAAYYYWIFPNTMLNFYPWGCSVNVVQPLGISLTKVSFLTYILDESKLGMGAGGDLSTVELEDEAVVESVQKGIRSRFYKHGRYSPKLETGTHHFHQLLCEYLNK